MVERLCDVIVIGGGIAGISAGAHLAADAEVVVLERERHPGTHATGRSAAMLIDGYGNAAIRALTAAGRAMFARPDPEFWPEALLKARGELRLGRPEDAGALDAAAAGLPRLRRLSAAEAVEMVPILAKGAIEAALHDAEAADIDVDHLLQGYLRLFRSKGGRIEAMAEVHEITRTRGLWHVSTGSDAFVAPVVVNAAGAWADGVAALAGVGELGITPMRRSAAILPAPEGHDPSPWPLFGSVTESWYAKPMGGKLMVSPAEEDPVEAQDAYADDMVLAEGIDRFAQMTTAPVTRVERSWAGLRSFAPDRTPVAGFDPRAHGFFWLAGQGGYGIQTAPALSALTAALVAGHMPALAPDVVAALDPGRPALKGST